MIMQQEKPAVYLPPGAPYVFISYCHADAGLVFPCLPALERLEQPFWYDSAIAAGECFNDEIARRISACEALIVFMSWNAARSRYVQDELTYARNCGRRIIVIQLGVPEDMTGGLRLVLSNLHQLFAADYAGPDALMAEALRALPGLAASTAACPSHDILNDCRATLRRLAQRIGVSDIRREIDPALFCPMHPAGKPAETVDLFAAVCGGDNHLLLQAEGGLGKTYHFLHTMQRLLELDRPCAYIPCHLLDTGGKTGVRLILEKLHSLYLLQEPYSQEGVLRHFRSYRETPFVLFLDGFNEAVNQDELAAAISQAAAELPGLMLVVSSRCDDPVFASFTHLTMAGLNEDTVRAMLRAKRNADYDSLNLNMRDLLLTPMFLRLYLGMEGLDREVDTAAELMDAFRLRTIRQVQQNDRAGSALIERALSVLFPDFMLREYESTGQRIHFDWQDFRRFMQDSGLENTEIGRVRDFLVQNHVVLLEADRRRFSCRHEHFRDYWVAFALKRRLKQQSAGGVSTETAVEVFLGSYTSIVLRYLGELSHGDGLLAQCLDALRRDRFPDPARWESEQTAAATARLISVTLALEGGRIPGARLDGLNLTRAPLNGVVTGSRFTHSSFTDALLSEETFFTPSHQGAPRRAELVSAGGRTYLVSLSDTDMLTARLAGSTLELAAHYSFGTDAPLPTLCSSAVSEDVIIAVDRSGGTWFWQLEVTPGGTLQPRVNARRILAGEKALKVTPLQDGDDTLLCVLCESGRIYAFFRDPDGLQLDESFGFQLQNFRAEGAGLCFAASSRTRAFYWAESAGGETTVWQYAADTGAVQALHRLETGELKADLMECVRSPEPCAENESLLVLSCMSQQKTVIYQLALPCSPHGISEAVQWPDGSDGLDCRKANQLRPPHHINSFAFRGEEMIASANDGHIYHFSLDARSGRYRPVTGVFAAQIADARFPIEHTVFTSGGTLAVLCVDRCVYLLDAHTKFRYLKLQGANDGLRRLCPLPDGRLLATSYDGCLLELQPSGGRYRCVNKRMMDERGEGPWHWSVLPLGNGTAAVGYIGGLTLFDIERDQILHTLTMPGIKVEHLHLDGGVLYAAENDEERTRMAGRVSCYRLAEGGTRLEKTGEVPALARKACYWIASDEKHLYFACNETDDTAPHIYRFDRVLPPEAQTPGVLPDSPPRGRYRDIQFFSGRYLVSCGPSPANGQGVSLMNLWDLSGGAPRMVFTLDGFGAYVFRCRVFQTPEENAWRLALIDSRRDGQIYKYLLRVDSAGVFSAEKAGEIRRAPMLCDLLFTPSGDLMGTDMDGNVFRSAWEADSLTSLFRNKSRMLTFGCGMAALARPVSPDSQLGRILTDFSCRVSKNRKGVRV